MHSMLQEQFCTSTDVDVDYDKDGRKKVYVNKERDGGLSTHCTEEPALKKIKSDELISEEYKSIGSTDPLTSSANHLHILNKREESKRILGTKDCAVILTPLPSKSTKETHLKKRKKKYLSNKRIWKTLRDYHKNPALQLQLSVLPDCAVSATHCKRKHQTVGKEALEDYIFFNLIEPFCKNSQYCCDDIIVLVFERLKKAITQSLYPSTALLKLMFKIIMLKPRPLIFNLVDEVFEILLTAHPPCASYCRNVYVEAVTAENEHASTLVTNILNKLNDMPKDMQYNEGSGILCALELLVRILEYDLVVWIGQSHWHPARRMRQESTRPLIAYAMWGRSSDLFYARNPDVILLMKLFVKYSGSTIPILHRNLSKLLKLVAELVFFSKKSNKKTYPYLHYECKYFSQLMYNEIADEEPDLKRRIDIIKSIELPWLVNLTTIKFLELEVGPLSATPLYYVLSFTVDTIGLPFEKSSALIVTDFLKKNNNNVYLKDEILKNWNIRGISAEILAPAFLLLLSSYVALHRILYVNPKQTNLKEVKCPNLKMKCYHNDIKAVELILARQFRMSKKKHFFHHFVKLFNIMKKND